MDKPVIPPRGSGRQDHYPGLVVPAPVPRPEVHRENLPSAQELDRALSLKEELEWKRHSW